MTPDSPFLFRLILCLAASALLWVQPAAQAQTPCPQCECPGQRTGKCGCQCDTTTTGNPCSSGGNDCNDPAFIASVGGGCKTVSPTLSAAQSARNANLPLPPKPAELVAAEQARYQAYLGAVRKNPDSVFPETLALWKSGASTELQRMAIVHALGVTKNAEELAALQFMLQALETPEVQRKECTRLARGNRAERTLASKRIVLLESNPTLKNSPKSSMK